MPEFIKNKSEGRGKRATYVNSKGEEVNKPECKVTFPASSILSQLEGPIALKAMEKLSRLVADEKYKQYEAGFTQSEALTKQVRITAKALGINVTDDQALAGAVQLGLSMEPPVRVVKDLPSSMDISKDDIINFFTEPTEEEKKENPPTSEPGKVEAGKTPTPAQTDKGKK